MKTLKTVLFLLVYSVICALILTIVGAHESAALVAIWMGAASAH